MDTLFVMWRYRLINTDWSWHVCYWKKKVFFLKLCRRFKDKAFTKYLKDEAFTFKDEAFTFKV